MKRERKCKQTIKIEEEVNKLFKRLHLQRDFPQAFATKKPLSGSSSDDIVDERSGSF